MVPYRKSGFREQYASSDFEYYYGDPLNMTDEIFNENMVRHNMPVNNPLGECHVFSDSDEETEYVQRVYREIPKKVYPPKKLHKEVQCESEIVELSGILKVLSSYCFENAKKCELEELVNISKWVGLTYLEEHNDQSPTVTSSFSKTPMDSRVQRDCSSEPRVGLNENSCINNERNECNRESNVSKEGMNNTDISKNQINVSKKRDILNSSLEESVGSDKKRKNLQLGEKSKSLNNKQKHIYEKRIRNASSIESEVKSTKRTIRLSEKQETPIKDLQQNLSSSKLNSVSGKQINISKRRGILNSSSEESDVESDKQAKKLQLGEKLKSINKQKNICDKSILNASSSIESEVKSTKQTIKFSRKQETPIKDVQKNLNNSKLNSVSDKQINISKRRGILNSSSEESDMESDKHTKLSNRGKSISIISKEKTNNKNMNLNISSDESKTKNTRQTKKLQIADNSTSVNNKQKSRIKRTSPKTTSDEPETEKSKVTRKLLVGDKLKSADSKQKSKMKRTNPDAMSDESEMEHTRSKRILLTGDKTKSVHSSQKNSNKRIVRKSSSDDPDFKIYNQNVKKNKQNKTQKNSKQQCDF